MQISGFLLVVQTHWKSGGWRLGKPCGYPIVKINDWLMLLQNNTFDVRKGSGLAPGVTEPPHELGVQVPWQLIQKCL